MPRFSLFQRAGLEDPLSRTLFHVGRLPVDAWTFIHVLFYFFFALYGMGFVELFVTSVIWEYFEWLLDRPREPHVLSDFLANVLGFLLGWAVRSHYWGNPEALPGYDFVHTLWRMGLPLLTGAAG